MPTVSIHMPEQSGETGLSLYLRKVSDGALLNAGGDALTESPASSGRFTATVAETISETLHAAVVSGGVTVRDGWVAAGETIVRDGYPGTGALTSEQQAQLDLIESQVATLSAGRRPQVVSPVSEGGHITLHRDTDYLVDSDSALEIPVDDVGGALAARLEAATLANLRFGAGRPNQGEEISGTVQAVTYSAGTETTTIVVEIERATLESAIVSDGYTYQIRRIDGSDRLVREVIGRLTVEENHVD